MKKLSKLDNIYNRNDKIYNLCFDFRTSESIKLFTDRRIGSRTREIIDYDDDKPGWFCETSYFGDGLGAIKYFSSCDLASSAN